ncbi:MAG: hypothetical protein U9Q68_07530 [Euryarchaeota archaeon]|nr:hypothetical protein [Euryarchaeota archaeon]
MKKRFSKSWLLLLFMRLLRTKSLNVSTLVLNNPYGMGFEEFFKEEFEKLGGTVINRVKYDPNG